MANQSLWDNVNTCAEIGFEILRLMEINGRHKGAGKNTEVEKIADGVLLMSNDTEVLIAVRKDIASQSLSEAAVSKLVCAEKDGYIIYSGAATAIPLYELSRLDESVHEYIVSDESLRATLCGNYPEYVKTHNMTNPPDARIEDTDAPLYLFLQKQLDIAADETCSQVAEFQHSRIREGTTESGIFDDVLELER
jgi:hypothetical protein